MFRIGKIEEPSALFMISRKSMAEHTLIRCPAWEEAQEVLHRKVGSDLSLGFLIQMVVGSGEIWFALLHFAEITMRAKEEAERRGRMSRMAYLST